MKLYEAKNIIRDTFESSFDKEKYTYFVKNLLKNLEEKPFGNGGAYTGNLIPRAFQSVIRKMERIGKFEDEEGIGILDIFDLYNFTVKEDEPLETEVAIDPEMLGKVFERMLEVKERKSKGAFYTPREIVHYMVQQSLFKLIGQLNLKAT